MLESYNIFVCPGFNGTGVRHLLALFEWGAYLHSAVQHLATVALFVYTSRVIARPFCTHVIFFNFSELLKSFYGAP